MNQDKNIGQDTAKTYGLLWEKEATQVPGQWHLHYVESVVGHKIAQGKYGIEVGCGCGFDTYHIAIGNPGLTLLSLDISQGVFVANKTTAALKNVRLIQASCLSLPVKDGSFDFAYSYGVLHHTTSPESGLKEIKRVLKKGAFVYLYLYESHSGNPLKFCAISILRLVRKITRLFPKKLLYIFSAILSPLCYVFFTLPSRLLILFKPARGLAQGFPFSFAKGPFSLTGDLYDRLGAPLEHRFSRVQAVNLMRSCGFENIHIGKITGIAGWVVWGNA